MSNDTHNILKHWRETVPNDRFAHLIRDTERAFRRALQRTIATKTSQAGARAAAAASVIGLHLIA